MNCGIYEIRNTANGKRYIGSSVSFRGRRFSHWSVARSGKHHSQHLQNAWNIYGEAAFVFKPILFCSTENLIMYEELCISLLKPEYNMCPVAGSCLGHKHTPESRKKMSDKQRGRRHSIEHVANQAASTRGQKRGPQTPEQIEHRAAYVRGKRQTPEHVEKRAAQRRGTNLSPETRKRMSLKKLGKKLGPQTPEWIDKRMARHRGQKRSAEACANMSAAQKLRQQKARL